MTSGPRTAYSIALTLGLMLSTERTRSTAAGAARVAIVLKAGCCWRYVKKPIFENNAV